MYLRVQEQEILYAVIDGASEDQLLPVLERLNPLSSCLYPFPVQDELVEIAPYLIEVNNEIKSWLGSRNTYWGLYLKAKVSFRDVLNHLRKYLEVEIEGRENPTFFRFYDPRNIWALCDVLDDEQLHNFLGPITSITTNIKGEMISNDFKLRRERFLPYVDSNRGLLNFNAKQIDVFEDHLKCAYVKKLTAIISVWHNRENIDYAKFCADSYSYFQELEITDDRTIRGLCKLFLIEGYDEFNKVSNSIRDRLEGYNFPPQVNAELLLVEKLGVIPSLDEV